MRARMRSSDPPPLQYLLECSRTSLQNFMTAQMNRAANNRKHIHQIADEWVEARALVLLSEWFTLYGEELIVLAAKPPETRHVAEHKPQEHINDSLTPKWRYEFWRSQRRHDRRRAR